MELSTPSRIRPFASADYDQVVELWDLVEGVTLNESDGRAEIESFLTRNPGFSFVAEDSQGQVVGAVLCGHNGRAGQLYHLAVSPNHRRKGIGHALVSSSFCRLSEAGIPRCNIFVYNDNSEGSQFWLRSGWADPETWKVLQKVLHA